MNNNKITDANVTDRNHVGGDLNQTTGDRNNFGGTQMYVGGDNTGRDKITNNTKNIGILGVLGTLVLIVILAIITMFFLGIDKKDIEKLLISDSALDNRQKMLISIRGTYLDEQNNELVFSPKSVSGMDGSVSMQGQVIYYYKLISENSIYIGGRFSKDGLIGIPFTLNDSQLELFTGEGDETRIFTKISDSY